MAAICRAHQRQLGRKPTAIEAAAIERAAVLQVLAADARNRILRGDQTVTYEAAVRADGAARRALRDLQAITRQPKASAADTAELAAILNGDGYAEG